MGPSIRENGERAWRTDTEFSLTRRGQLTKVDGKMTSSMAKDKKLGTEVAFVSRANTLKARKMGGAVTNGLTVVSTRVNSSTLFSKDAVRIKKTLSFCCFGVLFNNLICQFFGIRRVLLC